MPVAIYSRYYGIDEVVVDGQKSLAERRLPALVDYPDSLVHVIAAGETLDLLAYKYYGREDLWWRIADANPGRFPLDWNVGDSIVIPPPRVATRTAAR
jgi:phage tail protein X